MVTWLLAQALLASAATPADIRVVPELQAFTVILSRAEPGAPAGEFSGSVSLNGSSSEVPVTGLARVSGKRLELSVKMRYRDVPEDWIKRFRASDFDYRLRGRVAGGSPARMVGHQPLGPGRGRETGGCGVRLRQAHLDPADGVLAARKRGPWRRSRFATRSHFR